MAKKITKKQIKQDKLVTWTLNASQYVQSHFTQVISGMVILVALIGVILFTARARRNTAVQAEREFAVAMNLFEAGDREQAGTSFANIADRYSGHSAGVLANYFLGQSYSDQRRFQEALGAYDRYLQNAGKDAPFRVAASIGKAICYEGLTDYRNAALTLDGVAETMDEDDSRYVDVVFRAGTFYQRAGDLKTARARFREVADDSEGPLKDQAVAWLAILEEI